MRTTNVASQRLVRLGVAGLLLAGIGLAGGAAEAADRSPRVAPPPADVVPYLRQISGNHTITGQHNREPNARPSMWTAKVHDITGVYPGLWGGDFLFLSDDVANRQTMIDQAVTEWNNGSLVTLTWHVCPPTRGQSCGWDPGTGIQDDLSDEQWNDLVTDGGSLNQAWKERLDEAIPYLRQLQDAGVTVLFRPLHEMNDGWSWWGGRPGANGSRLLYQVTHDYLTAAGLQNLVWVWNVKDVDASAIPAYYPGDAYVDVLSLDPWVHPFPPQEYYDTLRSLASGKAGLPGEGGSHRRCERGCGGRPTQMMKPIALAEVGHIPSPSELAGQPDWTYFMVWAEYLTENNTEPAVKETYDDPRTLNQGDLAVR